MSDLPPPPGPPPPPPSASAAPSPSPASAAKTPFWRRRWFLITAGVIVALTIIGALAPEDEVEGESTGTADQGSGEEVVDVSTSSSTTTSEPASTTTEATTTTSTTTTSTTTTTTTTLDPRVEARNALTFEQQQAIGTAENYFSFSAFSRDGIIGQLEFEGYATSDAEAAIGYLEQFELVDWDEQAVASAINYLDFSGFSRSGLIGQLEFEGFSTEEATFGADSVGADWFENAVRTAERYLEFQSFSRAGLISQLEFEGFTAEEAQFGADAFFNADQ